MKCLTGLLILLASYGTCEAQYPYTGAPRVNYQSLFISNNSYNGQQTGLMMFLWQNQSGLTPFTPSGVRESANGGSGYGRPVPLNEVSMMNLSFVVKAKSLPPNLYKKFSKAANSMRKDAARSAILRRLIYELPSKMEGTTYVPPTPESMMKVLNKVVHMTDEQVAAYWSTR